MDIRLVLVPLPKDRGREPFDALGLVGGPAKLDGLVEGKLGAGKDTKVASLIGSSTGLNPTVPRPKLWLTSLSATTAGRDLAC